MPDVSLSVCPDCGVVVSGSIRSRGGERWHVECWSKRLEDAARAVLATEWENYLVGDDREAFERLREALAMSRGLGKISACSRCKRRPVTIGGLCIRCWVGEEE